MNPTLLALPAFLALQLAIGIWVSRRIASESDYLVAGRKLGYVLTTASIFATWFGAETIIGSAGEVYSNGLSLASAEPFGYGLCLVLMGAFLARAFWNRGLTTLADLYRQRFGTSVERLAAVMLIPSSVLWAAAQVRAFGTVIATTTPISVELAITLAAVFIVAYTAWGGLMADAVTDVLQGGVLTFGLVAMLVAVVMKVGGPGDAWTIIATTDRIDLAPAAAGPWLETVEAWAIPLFGSLTAGEIVSRVIAARSPTVAQRASLLAGACYITIGLIPVVIALLGVHVVPALDNPEQLLPAIARDALPPVLFAVFTGGLLSAILSTVDSTLLVASGLVSHNLIVPLLRITDDRRKLRLARYAVAFSGLVAYALALGADGVFELVEEASAFGSAGIVVTVLFALLTPWGSARTATMTLLGGVISYVGAVSLGASTPFILSLATALLLWGLGCLIDVKAR